MTALGLLRGARDEAIRFGRMTREDIAELTSVFMQVARRQAQDTLSGLERRLREALARARRVIGRPPPGC